MGVTIKCLVDYLELSNAMLLIGWLTTIVLFLLDKHSNPSMKRILIVYFGSLLLIFALAWWVLTKFN